MFCRLVRGDAPFSRVYENERALAFLDINPLARRRTLVIPKKHYEAIYDVPDDELAYLFKVVKAVALAVKEAMSADGVSVVQNNGRAAGQRIFHIHVHVIPRHARQKSKLEEGLEVSRGKLDEVAKLIAKFVPLAVMEGK